MDDLKFTSGPHGTQIAATDKANVYWVKRSEDAEPELLHSGAHGLEVDIYELIHGEPPADHVRPQPEPEKSDKEKIAFLEAEISALRAALVKKAVITDMQIEAEKPVDLQSSDIMVNIKK